MIVQDLPQKHGTHLPPYSPPFQNLWFSKVSDDARASYTDLGDQTCMFQNSKPESLDLNAFDIFYENVNIS